MVLEGMAFPELITATPGLQRGGPIAGPFFDATQNKFYQLVTDTISVFVYASPDGVTWAQSGIAAPFTLSFTQQAILGVIDDGKLIVCYADDTTGFITISKFVLATSTWNAGVLSDIEQQVLQVATLLVSETKLVVFGCPLSASITQKATVFTFDIAGDAFGVPFEVGLDAQIVGYPGTFPIGIAAGTFGRVHLIGSTPDAIAFEDHIWQQTFYPATDVLIAVDEFNDQSLENDLTLYPVCSYQGLIVVRQLVSGTSSLWCGVSADTIDFSTQIVCPIGPDLPGLPAGGYTQLGIIASADGIILVGYNEGENTLAYYFYCTFDGTVFDDWINIGGVLPNLFTSPFPYLSASESSTDYMMNWRGSIYFWGFAGSPVVGGSNTIFLLPLNGPVILPDPRTHCKGNNELACKTVDCCGRQMRSDSKNITYFGSRK